MPPKMHKRWYIAECPLKDQCSKASWDKTRYCTSYESADESRKHLAHHLNSSGLHRDTVAENGATYVDDLVALVHRDTVAENGATYVDDLVALADVWEDEVTDWGESDQASSR
jgi:hypothetical protein